MWRVDKHKDANNSQSSRRLDKASTSCYNSVTLGSTLLGVPTYNTKMTIGMIRINKPAHYKENPPSESLHAPFGKGGSEPQQHSPHVTPPQDTAPPPRDTPPQSSQQMLTPPHAAPNTSYSLPWLQPFSHAQTPQSAQNAIHTHTHTQ
eukprot:4778125-Amphidinium_carterae.2